MKIGQLINPPPPTEITYNQQYILDLVSETHTAVISRMDGTIKVIGQPSYTEYTFTNENRVQLVKNEDVPDLLSKERRSKPCCNGEDTDLHIFAIYKS